MSKAKDKPAEPAKSEAASSTATQQAAGAPQGNSAQEPPEAGGETAEKVKTITVLPAVPDEACGAAVRGFIADWLDDRPAEAAGGHYSPTARDRWAERRFAAIPDGTVLAYGWAFSFADGRFVGSASLDTLPAAFVSAGQLIPMIAHETTD